MRALCYTFVAAAVLLALLLVVRAPQTPPPNATLAVSHGHVVGLAMPGPPEVILKVYPENLTGPRWRAYRVDFNARMRRRMRAGQATRVKKTIRVEEYHY